VAIEKTALQQVVVHGTNEGDKSVAVSRYPDVSRLESVWHIYCDRKKLNRRHDRPRRLSVPMVIETCQAANAIRHIPAQRKPVTDRPASLFLLRILGKRDSDGKHFFQAGLVDG
jgi:hypothetical protein